MEPDSFSRRLIVKKLIGNYKEGIASKKEKRHNI
jgi:hypothetical protein